MQQTKGLPVLSLKELKDEEVQGDVEEEDEVGI